MEPAVITQAKQATRHCNMSNQQEAADKGNIYDGNQYCKNGKTVHTPIRINIVTSMSRHKSAVQQQLLM